MYGSFAWADVGSTWSLANSTALPNERYVAKSATATGTLSTSNNMGNVPTFYHQYNETIGSFNLHDGSAAISLQPTAYSITGRYFGSTTSSTAKFAWWDYGAKLNATSVTWEGIQVANATYSIRPSAGGSAQFRPLVYEQDSNQMEFAGASQALTAISWSAGLSQLSFTGTCTASAPCIVFSASSVGQPYYVSVSGTLYTQGSGWTTNGQSNPSGYLTTVTAWPYASAVPVIVSWTPSPTSPGSSNNGQQSQSTTATTTAATQTSTTSTQQQPPINYGPINSGVSDLIVLAILIFTFIGAGLVYYRHKGAAAAIMVVGIFLAVDTLAWSYGFATSINQAAGGLPVMPAFSSVSADFAGWYVSLGEFGLWTVLAIITVIATLPLTAPAVKRWLDEVS
jgi:hypothetical protein